MTNRLYPPILAIYFLSKFIMYIFKTAQFACNGFNTIGAIGYYRGNEDKLASG